MFPDPNDLSRAAADQRCPSCDAVADFADATSEQIQAIGFTSDQYQ